jgi:hypothetical protein
MRVGGLLSKGGLMLLQRYVPDVAALMVDYTYLQGSG